MYRESDKCIAVKTTLWPRLPVHCYVCQKMAKAASADYGSICTEIAKSVAMAIDAKILLHVYGKSYECIGCLLQVFAKATCVWLRLQVHSCGYKCIAMATCVWLWLQVYGYGYKCMATATCVWLWLQLHGYGYKCMAMATSA